MTLPRNIVSTQRQCPDCGALKTLRYHKRIRRFRPRQYSCDDCDFVGPRGAWPDADMDDT